ncbi:MAG: 30S ribosomal protein S4 [Patescibacteria group bacterium]|nr:30S ribosomal protein S4 [Patescibacteria group bacterium]
MMGPKEKKERRIGERLHLKGQRCDSPKCAMVKKPYPPGVHGQGRHRAPSDYGRQLREKQKVKYIYGVKEKTLWRFFQEAKREPVSTIDRLAQLLEGRLDNVIYRLGFAVSRLSARQLVSHGHIFVNGKRTRSPAMEVRPGDTITIRTESKGKVSFKDLNSKLKKFETPDWLTLDPDKLEGKIKNLPSKMDLPIELSLLVELFSK